jgi:hypothetical protein
LGERALVAAACAACAACAAGTARLGAGAPWVCCSLSSALAKPCTARTASCSVLCPCSQPARHTHTHTRTHTRTHARTHTHTHAPVVKGTRARPAACSTASRAAGALSGQCAASWGPPGAARWGEVPSSIRPWLPDTAFSLMWCGVGGGRAAGRRGGGGGPARRGGLRVRGQPWCACACARAPCHSRSHWQTHRASQPHNLPTHTHNVSRPHRCSCSCVITPALMCGTSPVSRITAAAAAAT